MKGEGKKIPLILFVLSKSEFFLRTEGLLLKKLYITTEEMPHWVSPIVSMAKYLCLAVAIGNPI